MTKLKSLKNELKNRKAWVQYAHMFKHKQMKLLFSKVALIYNPDLTIEELILGEFDMMKSSKKDGVEMFVKAFSNMEAVTKHKANWEEFGRFVFYAYQTSTYWKDSKKKIENIYNKDNYIQMNAAKRKHFYNWLHSLDINDDEYNSRIIKTMQRVF